jgi:putative membrane protein
MGNDSFVINGLMLWLVSLLVKGFVIQNFIVAVIAAFILMVISSVISFFVKE